MGPVFTCADLNMAVDELKGFGLELLLISCYRVKMGNWNFGVWLHRHKKVYTVRYIKYMCVHGRGEQAIPVI